MERLSGEVDRSRDEEVVRRLLASSPPKKGAALTSALVTIKARNCKENADLDVGPTDVDDEEVDPSLELAAHHRVELLDRNAARGRLGHRQMSEPRERCG